MINDSVVKGFCINILGRNPASVLPFSDDELFSVLSDAEREVCADYADALDFPRISPLQILKLKFSLTLLKLVE